MRTEPGREGGRGRAEGGYDKAEGGRNIQFVFGPGSGAGDAGGDVDREQAFARAGIAGEERHLAEGNSPRPEPLDILCRVVGGAAQVAATFWFTGLGLFWLRCIENGGVGILAFGHGSPRLAWMCTFVHTQPSGVGGQFLAGFFTQGCGERGQTNRQDRC
jgi:hypothetical protein